VKRIGRWLQANSLWLVSLGLMVASSGIDGAYMARWMTDLPGIGGAEFLGYVLNTTADVAGVVLMYWFGRLQQAPKNAKRYKLSWALLPAEVVAVGYSLFFGGLQLSIVMDWESHAWVPWVSAGFIPLLLAFTGYAQALLAGRIESAERAQSECGAAHDAKPDAQGEAQPVASAAHGGNGHAPGPHVCEYCGRTFGTPQGVSAHLRFCEAYQDAQEVEE